jgi:hypothetical protein
MRGQSKAQGRMALGFLLLMSVPAFGADVTVSAKPDRTAVRLSESVIVTLAVEGPAPLRVELPNDLLDEPSALAWRLREAGPAKTEDLPAGRQRWSRSYRADPYQPGEKLRLGFAAAQAFAGANPRPQAVEWSAVEVTVTTEVAGDLAELRPPTGIELLPAPPTRSLPAWGWAAGTVGVAVIALALGTLVRRAVRRSAAPLPPREWVIREFDRLAAEPLDGGAFAERLSGVLRTFLERRTGLPSTRLTTAEFAAAAATVEPPVPVAQAVSVLEWSDRVKFAGWRPSAEDCAARLADARVAVAEVCADDQPPSG